MTTRTPAASTKVPSTAAAAAAAADVDDMMHYSDSDDEPQPAASSAAAAAVVEEEGDDDEDEEAEVEIQPAKKRRVEVVSSSSSDDDSDAEEAPAAAASASEPVAEEEDDDEMNIADEDEDDDEPAPIVTSKVKRTPVAAAAVPAPKAKKPVPAAAAAAAAPSRVVPAWGSYGIRLSHSKSLPNKPVATQGLVHTTEIHDTHTGKWHVVVTDTREVVTADKPETATLANTFSTRETFNAGPFSDTNKPIWRTTDGRTNVTWVACVGVVVWPLTTKEDCDRVLDNSGLTTPQKNKHTRAAKDLANALAPPTNTPAAIMRVYGGVHHIAIPWAKYYAAMDAPLRKATAAATPPVTTTATKRKRAPAASAAPPAVSFVDETMINFFVPDLLAATMLKNHITTTAGMRAYFDQIRAEFDVGIGREVADMAEMFEKFARRNPTCTKAELMHLASVRTYIVASPLGQAAAEAFALRIDRTRAKEAEAAANRADINYLSDY